jgi:hypothetical protein
MHEAWIVVSFVVVFGATAAVAVIAFIVLCVVDERKRGRQRKRDWTLFGERHGLRLVEALPISWKGAWEAACAPAVFFRYMLIKPSPLCRSLHVEGRFDGGLVRLGDFHNTAHESSSEMTVATIDHPRLEVPAFCVEPRTRGDGLWFRAFDLEPVAFPDDPAFEERFVVRGPDAAGIRGLLTDAVRRELLLRGPWSFEGYGQTLMMSRASALLEPPDSERLLKDLQDVSTIIVDQRG